MSGTTRICVLSLSDSRFYDKNLCLSNGELGSTGTIVEYLSLRDDTRMIFVFIAIRGCDRQSLAP